jgi:hypothetical protein
VGDKSSIDEGFSLGIEIRSKPNHWNVFYSVAGRLVSLVFTEEIALY